MALTLFLFVLLALMIWTVLFAALPRLPLSGKIAPLLQELRDHRLTEDLLNLASNYCNVVSDNASDRAKNYLLRVVALTSATRVGDSYVVEVGAYTFQVRERYISRLQGTTGAKLRYGQTCYFCLNKAIPSEEQIATVLLMLKNSPALFDKWAIRNGVPFKADGQRCSVRE